VCRWSRVAAANFLLRRICDELRDADADAIGLCPGDFLGIGEAATLSPTLIGGAAATGAKLAGEWL